MVCNFSRDYADIITYDLKLQWLIIKFNYTILSAYHIIITIRRLCQPQQNQPNLQYGWTWLIRR